MFTIELTGGLGNQLFQVCFLLAYCMKYNKPHKCFPAGLGPSNQHTLYWETIFKPLSNLVVKDLPSLPVVDERHFHYHEYEEREEAKFHGYFQSYRYFDNYRSSILEQFNIKTLQDNERIIHVNFKATVSMHFRIGDYKTMTDTHPILPLQYYIEALHKISSRISTVLFFYEIEDEKDVLEKIKAMRDVFPEIRFLSGIVDRPEDWRQMILMSKCYHHIIANSSFSWWGAYLSEGTEIYYPKQWFGPVLAHHKTDDLFPQHWRPISL